MTVAQGRCIRTGRAYEKMKDAGHYSLSSLHPSPLYNVQRISAYPSRHPAAGRRPNDGRGQSLTLFSALSLSCKTGR